MAQPDLGELMKVAQFRQAFQTMRYGFEGELLAPFKKRLMEMF